MAILTVTNGFIYVILRQLEFNKDACVPELNLDTKDGSKDGFRHFEDNTFWQSDERVRTGAMVIMTIRLILTTATMWIWRTTTMNLIDDLESSSDL